FTNFITAVSSDKDGVNSGLLLRIYQSAGFVRWIGHRANVRYQRSDVALGKRVSPGRHLRRFVQGGTAVADDGDEVGIAHFVESVAFGERMWLDREVVHVGDALRRGLRIVAADAVLRVVLRSYRLLVTQRDLVNREANGLSRRIARAGQDLVSPRLLAEIDLAGDLSAGIGKRCGGGKTYAGGPAEID